MEELIQKVMADINYEENPYFKALQDKTFEFDDFLETQIQFYFAVVFFSRPMAALAAKVPNSKQRIEIVRNVWEEHGEGENAKLHGDTFLELLKRLGVKEDEEILKRALWPEVRQFNTTLVGACLVDEYTIGVGVMGIIELMFSRISAWVGQGIVHNGWLTNENMIHYNLHEELDIKHSQDFFDVIAPKWEDPEERYYIEQGLRLGAHTFNGLYEGLYAARKRRDNRATRGLHSRA